MGTENALSPGSYLLVLRHASQIDSGRIRITAPERDELLNVFNVPNTGGWQNWASTPILIQLGQRTESLEFYAESGGWNLNWFEVEEVTTQESLEGALTLDAYESIEGTYPDGETYTLRKPVYQFTGEAPSISRFEPLHSLSDLGS